MLGSLVILFLLHLIVTFAQSPISQITNCAELMSLANYPQAVNLQPQNQEMAAVQVANRASTVLLDRGTDRFYPSDAGGPSLRMRRNS